MAPATNVQSEKAFRRGNATSRAPICSGTRKLKNAAESGMTPRKIIVVPCMVNSWLYMRAVTKSLSGRANCVRMAKASTPPMRKKSIAKAPYMMPSFLWSTVVNQSNKPRVRSGRKRPRSLRSGASSILSATGAWCES